VTAIGVLGPLLLTGPDRPIPVGSARQRLLAALVAHLGAPVGVDVLTELMWDSAPANPTAAVQTNVALLRRLLPVGIRVVTPAEGYQLHADRVAVDVSAFRPPGEGQDQQGGRRAGSFSGCLATKDR
jgi:DNA-binding SARP family transcriptional activator